jgi:hypothetical protein
LTGLVKQIDERLESTPVKTPRPPGVFVIFLKNPDGLDGQLRATAEKVGLKRVSQCIGTAPQDYEVAQEADITVVIYRSGPGGDNKVSANFALRKGELDQAKTAAIVKALSDALPR